MVPILPHVTAARLWTVCLVVVALSCVAWVVLDGQSGGWSELARIWGLLAAGSVIGFAAALSRREGMSESGAVNQLTYEDLFFDALDRELCRARRDEESFAVLSVDWKDERSGASLGRMCELLDAHLRAYADIAQVGDRVLALIPRVADSQYEPLLKRLQASLDTGDCGEARIGLARYPQDAVCAKELVDMADRKRLVRGVVPPSGASQAQTAQGQISL